jgi:hypothetical protein
MTLFFPDVNVWLALSIADHSHAEAAWQWLDSIPPNSRLLFSRYAQLGLLRLLTNPAVTGKYPLTLREAWAVYDGWMSDRRVQFYPEPRNVDSAFLKATEPFASRPSSKWISDCWVLAFSSQTGATLVTFDKALFEFARKQGYAAIVPR